MTAPCALSVRCSASAVHSGKPTTTPAAMAAAPADGTTPGQPFTSTSIDYKTYGFSYAPALKRQVRQPGEPTDRPTAEHEGMTKEQLNAAAVELVALAEGGDPTATRPAHAGSCAAR